MAGAVGLSARVHVQAGRACVRRPHVASAQPRVRRCAVQPLAMANPFDDKKKEAAKRALMSALEGKADVLKENELKEIELKARLKAQGSGGGRGGGGGGGGGRGGGGDDGKWKKEAGTTLQTLAIIVGGVSVASWAGCALALTLRLAATARSSCCSTRGASCWLLSST